jgi:hypothetical protein
MAMFTQHNSRVNRLNLEGVVYDGTQAEFRCPVNSPFDYGDNITIGGTKYTRDHVENSIIVYKAQAKIVSA